MAFDQQKYQKVKDALRINLMKAPQDIRKPLIEGMSDLILMIEELRVTLPSVCAVNAREQIQNSSNEKKTERIFGFHERWWNILQQNPHKMRRALKFSLSQYSTPEDRKKRLEEIVKEVNEWADQNGEKRVSFPYKIDL